MRRPKVGETWLLESSYSWQWCIVQVMDVEIWYNAPLCKVIDCKDNHYNPDGMYCFDTWNFSIEDFVRNLS